MFKETHIDPMVSFRNSQGEVARGTIINLQRKALVMEVYNPHSIVQVSEVVSELTIRLQNKNAYIGRAVVISMVNTGLTAVVSVTLIDEWRELTEVKSSASSVGEASKFFVQDWAERFNIGRDYQIVINETRAFLAEVSRWVEQVDLSETLPMENGCLRKDVFYELATPLISKTKNYFDSLELEASRVPEELAPAHRSFAQAALHPYLLRSPFVFRTYTKPLGYAGDYMMVNQLLDEPQQGPSTYFQIVNTAFLQTAVVTAHRNRIGILEDFLIRMADKAKQAQRPFRVLNIGCGPAVEIQRFLKNYSDPHYLSFELVDFSTETLQWTENKLQSIIDSINKPVSINYAHDSVHKLLKRRINDQEENEDRFDAVYCAGLFDYLSDKVCTRLMAHFAERTKDGGTLLVTNVHSDNPEKFSMEHVLEWYLIYRNEAQMLEIFPKQCSEPKIWRDITGVNVFAETTVHMTDYKA